MGTNVTGASVTGRGVGKIVGETVEGTGLGASVAGNGLGQGVGGGLGRMVGAVVTGANVIGSKGDGMEHPRQIPVSRKVTKGVGTKVGRGVGNTVATADGCKVGLVPKDGEEVGGNVHVETLRPVG